MENKASSFLKGGLGCFALFVVGALLAVLFGGSAYLDIGGAILLFVIGGIIGLVVNYIYEKGKKEASDRDQDSQGPT